MAKIFVLDSASGDARILTPRQLSKEIKEREQKALLILDSHPDCYVLFALKRKSGNRVEYHMMPYTLYSDRKYKAIFDKQATFTPLSVCR